MVFTKSKMFRREKIRFEDVECFTEFENPTIYVRLHNNLSYNIYLIVNFV